MNLAEFSLIGGPLHRLGIRLGLVRGASTIRLGITIGATLWVVLIVLAAAGGALDQVFWMSSIAGHVRLLFVIPLLFHTEFLVGPRQTTFVELVVRSGVISPETRPRFERELSRLKWLADSWLLELVCVAVAIVFSVYAGDLVSGSSASVNASELADMKLAGLWYWFVCLPVFRFLLARVVVRVVLWAYFIWRFSLLDLKLIATHPDAAGGIGYLEVVLTHYAPLLTGISAIQSASLAEEISKGTATTASIVPTLAFLLAGVAILFVAPLLLVLRKLWRCQVKALDEYMDLASTYVTSFDRKWLRSPPPAGETLLGTSDIQSLADLNNAMLIVRKMRIIPISIPVILGLAFAAAVPLLPLLLFEYPLTEIATKFLSRLTGF